MKKIGIVAITATAALALAGCSADGGGGGGGETGDIRVWINGTDTPADARDYLKETFEEENPGSTLTIEEQAWTGLVDKLNTALPSSDSPDVIEIGNTQAPAFTSVGAFLDLSDKYEELGGDDLLPGFVESGTFEDAFYAAPYYSGSRIVFYRTDMFEKSGVEVPTTLEEYVAAGKQLAADNDGVSGIYMPGKDQYNVLPYIWENGGEIAVQADDGTWDAQFSSPESVKGLEMFKDVSDNASLAPKDGDGTNPQVPFCADEVAILSAANWVQGSILAPEDAEAPGCPDMEANLGVMALPGLDGGAAQVFAGGSNIAISAKSKNQDLAYKALQIMLSDEYQTILGENGLVPAKTSLASTLGDSPAAQASAEAAATAKLTPASPKWADVEASQVMLDFFASIAQGGDVQSLAEKADSDIEAILNG
ncbi:extracellular solute-binding protein [Homoserinibacter sp. YIM 151385]|uniref:extracellular solute-binding protein n=1 Tax=Homoserinibacter sp. YIM 151385 TaxID=2985506 RepID=UPI0022F1394D|nr:extracellular solute-binding protein [Homoserinibacter sp. YIM 151385]WBU36774.1 extracellular solute-binding protein [Homoserinibacter sp. YIM 151385]